jgi:hypothetical protein
VIQALATPDRTIYSAKTLGKYFPLPEWGRWRTVVKAAYGLPLDDAELAFFQELSGRTVAPKKRAKELWIASGRRSGKTATASGITVHTAAFHDFKPHLRPPEAYRSQRDYQWEASARLPLTAEQLAVYRECTDRTEPPDGPAREGWLVWPASAAGRISSRAPARSVDGGTARRKK